jgi:hypothetical protein
VSNDRVRLLVKAAGDPIFRAVYERDHGPLFDPTQKPMTREELFAKPKASRG